MSRAVRLAAALLLACLGLVLTTTAAGLGGRLHVQAGRGWSSRSARPTSVFIGTVDRRRRRGQRLPYDITASRAYQGTPERETQVLSAGGRDACGLGELGVGTGYLFFATGTETPYAADACGGTGVANPTKVDKVEGLLGAGTAVEPPRRRRPS